VLESLSLSDQGLLQSADQRIKRAAGLNGPEADGGSDLIVSATTGVKLGCDVTDFFV
jgi:hypothetical protein